MASEVKTDKLSPSGGTALQIGDASDTITIPTGATLTITDGLGVAAGGTGLASFTAGDILYATGTTTLAKLAKGSAEQVLAMNSGATAPDWGSVDLTVLPTITAAKGGTGQTSYTTGDTVYASGSTAVSKLGIGTARQGLQTNSGASAPEWVDSPQSLMTAAGDILYASGANTLAKLAKGSDDEVLTLASGVPSWATAGGGSTALLATVSGDGSTNPLTFDGYFTSAYDVYLINISNLLPVTNNTVPSLRVRVSDADVSTGIYYGAEQGNRFTTTSNEFNNGGTAQDNTYMTWGSGMSNTATFECSAQVWIYRPLDTTAFKSYQWNMNWWSDGATPSASIFNVASGFCRTTSALTGVSFSMGGFGSVINTGTFQLYGIKNS